MPVTSGYDAVIRPPPGLEHITYELQRPWEHFSLAPVPPPQFEAPKLMELKTPPAPHQEPSVQEPCVLTLLKHLPPQPVHDSHHDSSSCRPCAFFHTKGCALQSVGRQKNRGQSGTQCSFCHLCPPGEKKRRQKLRRKAGANPDAWLRSTHTD